METGRMKRSLLGGLAAALLALAQPARADWIRAETDRFIVYGDVSEAQVRDYAVKLNTFHEILHAYNPRASNEPPPRKFEVYLLRQQSDIQRIEPRMGRDVAGFYTSGSQAEFAVAFIGSEAISGDTVLFHEYAHHFMFANFPAAYPAWFVEGWAEYFGNTRIKPNEATVGGYNANRVAWLNLARWIRWDELFNKRSGDLSDAEQVVYYPQAWLFVHYMMSSKERAAQLNTITTAIAKGETPAKAVHAATGMSQSELNHELQGYTKLQVLLLKDYHPKTEVKIAHLAASADDLLLDSLRLSLSDIDRRDARFLAAIRRKAAKYPGDPLADQVLALAEFTYGDVAAGEAIVNRRLAVHPDELETLRVAGVGQIIAGERDRTARAARYRASRTFLIKAYGLDKTDFRTLYAYAFSRTVEPGFPNDNDLNALVEAHALSPAADDITVLAADALRRRGKDGEARALLSVVANNPHGGDDAERARAMMAGAPLPLDGLELISRGSDDKPKKPPGGGSGAKQKPPAPAS
jgi:hypothetical protein